MIHRTSLAVVLVLVLAVSCAPAPSTSPSTPSLRRPGPVAASSAPPHEGGSYVDVFDSLVKRIESTHVFPPAFVKVVGHPWAADVPVLREEMLRAKTREDALIALSHLQNSLRDGHCWLEKPSDVRHRPYALGVSYWAGGTLAAPDVRVSALRSPALEGRVHVGDRVVAVDGVPIARWFAEHRFETRLLEPSAALDEIAYTIFVAEEPFTHARKGTERKLRLARDASEVDVTLVFDDASVFKKPPPDIDNPPPMAEVGCDNGWPAPEYGDYTLSAMGVNVCIYTPKASHDGPARPKVPIVRWVSFAYSGRGAAALRTVKVDHDLMKRELAGAAAVILDVHENSGGNNPFLFLDWFAKKPVSHELVRTKVVPGLDDGQLDQVFFGESERVDAYKAALAAGKPSIESRFLCESGTCEDVAPKPAERVTEAPVAVLTGAGCMSSCDTFVLTWRAAGLGLIAGEQPNHGYTVNRLPIALKGPNNESLGEFKVALSASYLPGSAAPIEGEPLALDWEAPHTFETRSSWTKLAVDDLRRRLTKR
jgi:hypothetical protein